MRERGSNTARPKKKGVGGLPIGARPVDFGASIGARPVDLECCLCRDFGASVVPVVSRFADFLLAFRPDSVDSVDSRRVEVKAQTQKKPDSSIGESGSAIARRRALLTFCQFLFQILVQALEAFG